MPTSQTFILVISNLLLLIYLLWSLWSAVKYKDYDNKTPWFSCFVIFMFMLFAFWDADYFGYMVAFKAEKSGWTTHLEDFYRNLINNHLTNYFQFRLIVWGGGIVLLYFIIKRLKINKLLSVFSFVACSLIWFSYSRVSLAMAMMMLGASFLVSDDSRFNITSMSVGVALIILSTYLHKSAYFGVAMICLSYISMLSSQNMMKISLYLLPLLIFAVSGWLSQYMQINIDEDVAFSRTITSGQKYMEQTASSRGIGTLIGKWLEWLPKYLTAYLCYKFCKDGIESSPRIYLMINIMFYVMLVSSIFFFDLGYNTNTVFSRFQRYAMIPLFIVLAYFYDVDYHPKMVKRILFIAALGEVYAVAYSSYNVLVSS